jgi:hypothetical protein
MSYMTAKSNPLTIVIRDPLRLARSYGSTYVRLPHCNSATRAGAQLLAYSTPSQLPTRSSDAVQGICAEIFESRLKECETRGTNEIFERERRKPSLCSSLEVDSFIVSSIHHSRPYCLNVIQRPEAASDRG